MKQKTSQVKNCNFAFDILTPNTDVNKSLSLALHSIDLFQRKEFFFGPFFKTKNKIHARYFILSKESIEAMDYVANGQEFDASLTIYKPNKNEFDVIASKTFKVKINKVYLNECFDYEDKDPMFFYIEMEY